jgi:hypothetical protein
MPEWEACFELVRASVAGPRDLRMETLEDNSSALDVGAATVREGVTEVDWIDLSFPWAGLAHNRQKRDPSESV